MWHVTLSSLLASWDWRNLAHNSVRMFSTQTTHTSESENPKRSASSLASVLPGHCEQFSDLSKEKNKGKERESGGGIDGGKNG